METQGITKFEESEIHPNYVKINGGILIRGNDIQDSMHSDILEHYYNKAPEQLLLDKAHYNKMFWRLQDLLKPLKDKQYHHCYSYGGGFPKFESFLNIDEITVFDNLIEIYQEHLDLFRNTYEYHKTINYRKLLIETPSVFEDIQIDQDKTLISFVHILEHLPIVLGIGMLEKLPKGVDVLIYNPNVERAQDSSWFHFKPKDHITLIPLKTLDYIIRDLLKYKIYLSVGYLDDLLIYFNTGN